ncbi:hypothetical protein LCGC14_2633800, partial [marine sediment metagenome]
HGFTKSAIAIPNQRGLGCNRGGNPRGLYGREDVSEMHYVKPFTVADIPCGGLSGDCTTITEDVTCKRCLKWLDGQEVLRATRDTREKS